MIHPVALVLGWKWDHPPGLTTRGNEVISWPPGFDIPSKADLERWDQEYVAFLAAEKPTLSVEEIADLLVEKGTVTRQEIDDRRGTRPGAARAQP